MIGDLSRVGQLSIAEVDTLCKWLLEYEEQVRLYQIHKLLFDGVSNLDVSIRRNFLDVVLDNLILAPFLTLVVLLEPALVSPLDQICVVLKTSHSHPDPPVSLLNQL